MSTRVIQLGIQGSFLSSFGKGVFLSQRRLVAALKLFVAMLTVVAGTGVGRVTYAQPDTVVRPISSRADAVSGGDVLMQVDAPPARPWRAYLNGRDVTAEFRATEHRPQMIGRLTNLRLGRNDVEIHVGGRVNSTVQLINHPLTGPIFSGPHPEPFICQTVENGLGPELDSDCSAKTVIQYYYKSTEPVASATFSDAFRGRLSSEAFRAINLAPGFKVFDPSGPPPSDVAQTVTSDGRTVKYIVRREIGTINRAVYDLQFLHQPGEPLPTPWNQVNPSWNGRLLYLFGVNEGFPHVQGTLWSIGRKEERFLAQGYALATSAPTEFDDKIVAETLSMVKEHFIKQYGEPVYTIGIGGSIGSTHQHLIAQNYPGLLDGLISFVSFPDLTLAIQSAADCPLLERAFKSSRQTWAEDQKTAVSGFATWRTCEAWNVPWLDPRSGCAPSVQRNTIYDQLKNPQGIRCDIYEDNVNVLGRKPGGRSVRRPLDNVGVQYGLNALNNEKIDAEQFLDLNELMGGYDEDGNFRATRTEADAEAVRLAYERGFVLTGGGGLSQVPIIDWREYTDDLADNHSEYASFVTRARLIAANGNADNQVIIVEPRVAYLAYLRADVAGSVERRGTELQNYFVRHMDRWLNNIATDKSDALLSAKVSRNRPADLTEGCWATDGERITEHATYSGPGRCNQSYPSHGDPRIAAGAPLTDDVLKCVLKPVDVTDYRKPLTTEQMSRLKTIFPTGVCDYSRPGIGQQGIKMTWQKF